jgi:peptide/nickel transport system permease protein
MTRVSGILRHDAVTLAAVGFLSLVVLVTIAAPLVAPHAPSANDYRAAFQLPSGGHLLGTDQLGRDLLSRLIYGGRISLVGVLEAMVVYLVLGLPVGLIAGYRGGWLDAAVVWIADVSFSLPQIVIVLAVLALFSNGTSAGMLVLGLLAAPGLAVMVRGATQAVRREQYIAAARVSGLHTWQILVRHVLPRVSGPIIVQTSLFAGAALLFQTALEFLGLGAHPPTPSWGSMVADGAQFLGRDGWMMVPGGVMITLMIVAFGLLGDAVHDARAGARSASARVRTTREQPVPVAVVSEPVREPARGLSRAADPDALLAVEGLSISLTSGSGAQIPLVEDVTFDLAAGRALGLVGESGCGKTLTALALTGPLPRGVHVVGGTVTYDGQQLHGLGEAQLRKLRGAEISMISQEPIASLDPSFSAGAQVAEVVRRHTGASRKQATAEALRLLELVKLPDPRAVARKYPHELSGGMAQRVSIAAALAGGPRLLIADEPTTALDTTVQAGILDLLRSLQQETGLAIVLVSHDWGVIADMCDAALVMYAGQVVEATDLATIFHAPRHPYTRALIESNPHYAKTPRSALPMIPGTVPPPGSWPVGCHFAARCTFCQPDCTARRIAEEQAGEGHWTRCLHHEELEQLETPEVSVHHG